MVKSDGLDTEKQRAELALQSAWSSHVPPDASALHARWWQLESWLRELVYVEMRAKYGADWSSHLTQDPERRVSEDANESGYMPTADAHYSLAYLDLTPLLKLVEQEWDILSHALLPQRTWLGRMDELRVIRNRISHCRRPHADDLGRLEQTLRDLEKGTFEAVSTFNREQYPDHELDDPVVDSWIRGAHPGAVRLIDHCEAQYDVRFRLRYSARPWARPRGATDPISGHPGLIWHAHWTIGIGYIDLRDLWSALSDDLKSQLIFVCSPSPAEVEISLPAIDNAQSTADAIERYFDYVILSRGRSMDTAAVSALWDSWVEFNDRLDPRVAVDSPWSIVDDSTIPITMFGA